MTSLWYFNIYFSLLPCLGLDFMLVHPALRIFASLAVTFPQCFAQIPLIAVGRRVNTG